MINVFKIRCFLTLAETLSFTKTAKLLFMTQQGVSKNIAHMEEEFGFPLFIRAHRTITLTEEGKQCYDLFYKFMEDYTSFLNKARTKYIQRNNLLRIGHQNWLDFGSIPSQSIAILRESMHDLELIVERCSPGELRNRFLDGKLDIILIHKRFLPEVSSFQSLELNRTPMVLLVAKNHPLNTPDATFMTFANETVIIDSFEGESHEESVIRACKEMKSYGLNPGKVIVVPNRDSVYTAAEFSQGVTVCNSLSQIRARNSFQEFPTDTMEPLLCVWHDTEKNSMSERYAKLLLEGYDKISYMY